MIPRPLATSVIFVLIFSILLQPGAPRAQTLFIPVDSTPKGSPFDSKVIWNKQTHSRDRLDSIYRASTETLHSNSGRDLLQTLEDYSKQDPHLKEALENELKLLENENRIAELLGERDSLVFAKPSKLSQNQIQSRLIRIEQKLEALKADGLKAKKAKKAQFIAKLIGGTLTAFSVYFQIQSISDAIRRVRIKEADLISRRDSIIKDGAKLEVLERKYENLRAIHEATKNQANTAKELIKAEQQMTDSFHELDQWRDVVKRSQQKILDAEETAMIDERTILRQKLGVGITVLGTLVISLFGDKIILAIQEWLESDDPKAQETAVLSFLNHWHVVRPKVMESSLLPSMSKDEVSPLDRSSIFFMSSEQLGVAHGVLERALEIYKNRDPNHYALLQNMAEFQLKNHILARVKKARSQLAYAIQFDQERSQGFYGQSVAPVDHTFVARPLVVPIHSAR